MIRVDFKVVVNHCEWLGWWSWSGTSLRWVQAYLSWGEESISMKRDKIEGNWKKMRMPDANEKSFDGQIINNSLRIWPKININR